MSVLESVEPAVTQRLKRRYGNFIGGEFRPPLASHCVNRWRPTFLWQSISSAILRPGVPLVRSLLFLDAVCR